MQLLVFSHLMSSAFSLSVDLWTSERNAAGLLSCPLWVFFFALPQFLLLLLPLIYFPISDTPSPLLLQVRPPLHFSLPFSCHSVPPPPLIWCCHTLLPLKLCFFSLPLSVCCECCLFLFLSSSLPPFLSLGKSAACVSAQQWEGLIHGDLKCNCCSKNPMTFQSWMI